jgi:DNA-binding transcriptional LysR family regulator
VEILDLKIFCDLVELKSFTESAKKNFLTQSAVSQRINRLNEYYGNKLFLDKKRLILSEHGMYLYEKFSDILRLYSHTEEIVQQKSVKDIISIGLSGNAKDKYFNQHILDNIFETEFLVELYFGSSQSIHEKILFGSIDYGIVGSRPYNSTDIESEILYTENIFLVTSASNPEKNIKLENIPIVLDHKDSGLYHFLKSTLITKGIDIQTLNIKGYIGTSKDKVEWLPDGNYFTFLPEWYLKKNNKLKVIDPGFELIREFYEIYQKKKKKKILFIREFIRRINNSAT